MAHSDFVRSRFRWSQSLPSSLMSPRNRPHQDMLHNLGWMLHPSRGRPCARGRSSSVPELWRSFTSHEALAKDHRNMLHTSRSRSPSPIRQGKGHTLCSSCPSSSSLALYCAGSSTVTIFVSRSWWYAPLLRSGALQEERCNVGTSICLSVSNVDPGQYSSCATSSTTSSQCLLCSQSVDVLRIKSKGCGKVIIS